MKASNQVGFHDGFFTQEEKESLTNAANAQVKEHVNSRKVEAVLVMGSFSRAKAPSHFYGWACQSAGHWGILVGEMLYHLVLKLDNDKKPVEIVFLGESFKPKSVGDGKGIQEEIGSTSFTVESIRAIGDALVLEMGDYHRLCRNSQAFAEILVQTICDVECKSSASLQIVDAKNLVAFSLTTTGGSIMHTKQSNVGLLGMEIIKNSGEDISWKGLIDAEITCEISKIGLCFVGSQSRCFIL